ncbi:MAG: MCE family protein [Planctomycetes bacterium]|nr:MCE family protein [Planctomycetota bacterium]
MSTDVPTPPPVARVEEPRRLSLLWFVPLLALVLAGVLGWQAWGRRGTTITVQLDDGHGLEAGDTLRHRGIVVGEVTDVRLLEGLGGVVAEVRLQPQADDMARVGSRFWVVRPELGLEGVAGLDTLVGAHYLAVLPGDGAPQRHFVGLPGAPIADALLPGLDVVLESPTRGNLRAGSPVTYRRMHVGSVLSVALASDGRTVEVAARVRQEFASLVQEGTRFWQTGGLEVDAGLSGMRVKLESLEALLTGGIALACPPGQQPAVRTGHRFALATEPNDEWLAWDPAVSLGHSLLPEGAPLVRPERAALVWTAGRLFSGEERREGWLVPVPSGVLGPADMLVTPDGAHADSTFLEVAGGRFAADPSHTTILGDLARVDVSLPSEVTPWPPERERRPEAPEDCLVVADPGQPPLSLAAGRLRVTDQGWDVDSALALDQRWHGAAVQARGDGALIGVLLVDGDHARVAPLP